MAVAFVIGVVFTYFFSHEQGVVNAFLKLCGAKGVKWFATGKNAMIVLMMGAMSLLSSVTVEAMQTAEGLQALRDTTSGIVMSTLVLMIPCIAITGPCTAGISYVTRNWARDEHAFIWSDFKDAIKENWKQALAISIITGFVPIVVYVCWNFYSAMAAQNGFMVVPQILTAMLGIIWLLALTYFYPLMVSYKLKMRDLLRNGLLMAVARFPQNLVIRLLHLVPLLIALVCAALGAQWGILAAGAGALVFAARQYRYVGKICEKDNRGEAL